MNSIQINAHNIKCGGCANSIKDKLNRIEGVHNTAVDVENGIVSFNYKEASSLQSAKESLNKMGYPETDPSLVQTGKSFVSCMIGRIK